MIPLPMSGKAATPDQNAQLLARTRVATPCPADWSQMKGDDKSRYCGTCRKNVYNLSAMTASEATSLIREKEGKLCVRYYQRADGTVMTQDCPVGMALLRRKAARILAASIVGFAAILSTITQWWRTDTGGNVFSERLQVWAERIHPTPTSPVAIAGGISIQPIAPPPPVPVKIGTPEPSSVMGDMVIRPEPEVIMGKVRVDTMPPVR